MLIFRHCRDTPDYWRITLATITILSPPHAIYCHYASIIVFRHIFSYYYVTYYYLLFFFAFTLAVAAMLLFLCFSGFATPLYMPLSYASFLSTIIFSAAIFFFFSVFFHMRRFVSCRHAADATMSLRHYAMSPPITPARCFTPLLILSDDGERAILMLHAVMLFYFAYDHCHFQRCFAISLLPLHAFDVSLMISLPPDYYLPIAAISYKTGVADAP